MRLITGATMRIYHILILILLLSAPALAADAGASQTTVTLVVSGETTHVVSEVLITSDDAVKDIGYTISGFSNIEKIVLSGAKDNTLTVALSELPVGSVLKSTLTYNGNVHDATEHPFVLTITNHTSNTTFYLHLSLETVPHVPPGGGSGTTPSVPDTPDTPDVPVNPDTPGSDEPGSDEPYTPILPPAGSVNNLAGFIPLIAGFLLLFLLFFMRGNLVYRILVKNAMKHGEKPDKEEKKHLKEIAGVIVGLVKVEDKYPEWRKNSDVMKRLWFDIESVLDEMNYPKIVPRGALVAEIIKAARGRINRHRL